MDKNYCSELSGIWTGVLSLAVNIFGFIAFSVQSGLPRSRLVIYLIGSGVDIVLCAVASIFGVRWMLAAFQEYQRGDDFHLTKMILNVTLVAVCVIRGILYADIS